MNDAQSIPARPISDDGTTIPATDLWTTNNGTSGSSIMPLVPGNHSLAIIGSLRSISGNINIAINIKDGFNAAQSEANPSNLPDECVDGHCKTDTSRSK